MTDERTREYMREYYRAHSTHTPRVPGASRMSKECKRCGLTKARDDFSICQSGPRAGHLSGHCKACHANTNRVAKDRDPTTYRRVEWPSKLKSYYGITVADYERMLAEQGGGCAICGTQTPDVGNRKYSKRTRAVFDVDHCHETGKVRGLLCTRCNRLVGLANDSAENAQRLVEYLRKEK